MNKVLTGSSSKNSRTNVAIVVFIPTKRLIQIKAMYAVLETSKKKDAGYMRGVIDHLENTKIILEHVKALRINKGGSIIN